MKPTPPKIPLTERQNEILQLVQQGSSNKEVARKLGIAEGTVRQHLLEIYRRLHVTNRTMAAQVGRQTGSESLFFSKDLTLSNQVSVPSFSRFSASIQPVSVVRVAIDASEALVNTLGSRGFARFHHLFTDVCEQESRRFDGVVRGVPEGLILLFGVPRLREDDPERAVCCAWRVYNRTHHLWREELDAIDFPVRICVVSGNLVVNSSGENTTLHGDLLAGPCETKSEGCRKRGEGGLPCVSEVTRRAVRAIVDRYGPLPIMLPAGSESDVAMVGGGVGQLPVADGVPFFGRGTELMTLRKYKELMVQGKSRSLLLQGEAGFGKTRLIQVFQAQVAGDSGIRWMTGVCRSTARHFLFHPFMPVLEKLAGCDNADVGFHARRGCLDRWVDTLAAPFSRQGRDLLALYDSATVLPDTVPDSGQLASAVDFLVGVLSTGPDTLLFLDNLHWADRGTRSCIPMLHERLNGSHVWLLGAGRKAELRNIFSNVGIDSLPLGKLSTRLLADLFRSSLKDWPVDEETLLRWARWCRGVPLFVLKVSARLLGTKDFSAIPTLEELEMFPESLLGLILERLYAADIDWRTARSLAALEKATMKQLLVLDLHGNAALTRAAVAKLVRVGLVEETGFGSAQAFIFTNGMVRAAIWHTLPVGDRGSITGKGSPDR